MGDATRILNISESELQEQLLEKSASYKAEGPTASKQSNPGQNIDPILLAYMMIFQTVQLGRDTAQIQAKALQINANAQNKLINEESKITIETLSWNKLFKKETHIRVKHSRDIPEARGFQKHVVWYTYKKIKTKIIDRKISSKSMYEMQSHNEEATAVRSIMEDQINLLRQGAQITETNINTTMDSTQQAIQQGVSLMQMLASLSNQIESI